MTRTKRVFTPEERLSLLQEAEREGFAETCRKHNLSPSLMALWRKKHFYALRTLLSCKWILERNEIPPMEFGKLRVLLDSDLNHIVDDLLELKGRTDETFTVKSPPLIQSWIFSRRGDFERHKPGERSITTDREPLNQLFRQYLQ